MVGHQDRSPEDLGLTPQIEVRLDPILHRREPQVLDARDVRLCERLVGELYERRAAPQAQRLLEQIGGAGRLAGGEGSPTLAYDPLEPVEIDRLRLDAQDVARPLRDEDRLRRRRTRDPRAFRSAET